MPVCVDLLHDLNPESTRCNDSALGGNSLAYHHASLVNAIQPQWHASVLCPSFRSTRSDDMSDIDHPTRPHAAGADNLLL